MIQDNLVLLPVAKFLEMLSLNFIIEYRKPQTGKV